MEHAFSRTLGGTELGLVVLMTLGGGATIKKADDPDEFSGRVERYVDEHVMPVLGRLHSLLGSEGLGAVQSGAVVATYDTGNGVIVSYQAQVNTPYDMTLVQCLLSYVLQPLHHLPGELGYITPARAMQLLELDLVFRIPRSGRRDFDRGLFKPDGDGDLPV